eukprot:TRINITY_DN108715_c0_g1_i1.p1 TRINITY_DN108715_c0_g1~~TRINITY_DN108715_c0_g1_i1.p1  ORF type:complete len:368 (+),score=59.38 TRINITY_DN108715_c0_g1_i1:98-1105(+)
MFAALVAAATCGVCAVHLAWLRLRRPKITVSGKHVLITGGSQGLGLALAKLCFQQGAKVTIVARTQSKLEAACADIKKITPHAEGACVQYFAMDVGTIKCKQFSELMGHAAAAFGRVDVLVANAGTSFGGLLLETSFDDIDEVLETQLSVNLQGALRCVTAASHVMAADGLGGRISIVSSAAGLISLPGYGIYSATKFGHRGFLAGAYHELQRHGILLSVYYPGSIQTPGFKEEQESKSTVTAKIEAQCSDVSSAESAAEVLLRGIEGGTMEITNELLPWLIVDHPTGCAPLDAAIAVVVQLIRAAWFIYLGLMSKYYIRPFNSPGASSSDRKQD